MRTSEAPPAALLAGLAAFVLLIGYLIASSLTRREMPTFAVDTSGSGRPPLSGMGADTLTIDAGDPGRWQFVDLDRGALVSSPRHDGWDLAVQRYRIAVRDSSAGSIGRWYSYGIVSHLLSPSGEAYVVRTSEGRRIELHILSYYCPGLRAGCLTFRYAALE